MRGRRLGLLLLPMLLHGSTTLHAAELGCQRPEVSAFASDMAQRHGMDAVALCGLFEDAVLRDDVLRLASPAPVSRPPDWVRYRGHHINPRRIRDGVAFWDANREVLERVATQSGVPASLLVAFIGVETAYGSNTGRHKTFDALATLAFNDSRRSDFFRNELESLLLLTREQNLPVEDVRGSYAGALGMPQFMPSSWRSYAVDGDGDGHIDLWASAPDAIASVANFMSRHGWRSGQPVAIRAAVDGEAEVTGGIRPDTPVGELQSRGVRLLGESPRDADGVLLRYGDEGRAEYWVGLDNFYVITRYNRSSFYAMAVWQLAEALEQARRRGS